MRSIFISDLHLDDARPESTTWLKQFLLEEARGADNLYILGDLFEYWLGDDVISTTATQVQEAIRACSDQGTACFFMHGNRDFLLGEEYAGRCGMQLLKDPTLIDLHGRPVVLLHGDTLCTDDTEYLAVRQMLRSTQWQSDFLSKTPAQRIAFAQDAREKSAKHKQGTRMEIMDANDDAVREVFDQTRVRDMIHGHTHRPAIHQHETALGKARRIVLGDWYTQGSALIVDGDNFDLRGF